MKQGGQRAWRVLVIALFSAGMVWSQVSTGTISGTLSDSTSAIVSGAQVTVRNVDTGVTRLLTTNERGRYVAPELPLGNYEVSASAPGLQTEVRRGIALAVGQEAVVNFSLGVGSVTEKVEVTAEAPLVETTTATVSSLVNEKTVRELPLNGRSFTDLMDLQTNVKNLVGARGTSPTMGYGSSFSVAGAHPGQNLYLLDGVNIGDSRVATPGSASGNVLGADTVREFRMLSSNYSAEIGLVSGGVMTAVTKSGTNYLHGTAFEFLRNSALDARRFFDIDPNHPSTRSDPPPYKRNQFGASLGGPLEKDRTFFFGSYEGLRDRSSTTTTSSVPTPATRRGFLPTGACASGCAVGPTAQRILNLYPLPSPGSVERSDGTADFIGISRSATREDYFTARIDQNMTDQFFLFGRYTFDDAKNPSRSANPLYITSEASRSQNFALNVTSLLSSTLLNTARVGVNRLFGGNPLQPLEDTDPSPLVFIPGRTAGSLTVPGLTGFGGAGNDQRIFVSTYFTYADDVNYTRGNHTLKVGASLQRNRDNGNSQFTWNGNWQFAALQTFFAENPLQLLSVTPQTDLVRGFRQWLIGSYVQDDWKVLPNLTLNLGLRMEWVRVPTEVNDKIATLRDLHAPATTVGGEYLELASAVAHLQPRVGMVWDPLNDQKGSIRAGFGMFQEALRQFDFVLPGFRMPPFYVNTLLSNPQPPAAPLLVFPDIFANFTRLGIPNVAPRLDMADFHLQQPYRLSWSFSIEREVLPSTLVNIGYNGARGVHLLNSWGDVNSPTNILGPDGRRYVPLGTLRPNTNFSQIRYRDTGNDSYYQALQLSVQKRFSRGFQVSSSYHWSKSIDTNSIILSQGTEFGNADQEAFPFNTKANRGPSSWDLRHYWSTNYVWELPFGPGKPFGGGLSGAGGKLLGGWSLSGVISLTSGTPFSPGLGFDFAGVQPQSGAGGQKPDLAPGHSLNPVNSNYRDNLHGSTFTPYFDVNAFVLPPLTAECALAANASRCGANPRRVFGNIGRNTMAGPGIATWNFSLLKSTGITEKSSLQFRAEFFNILNRANFRLPTSGIFRSGGVRNPDAGRITGVVTSARQIQFGLKLVF